MLASSRAQDLHPLSGRPQCRPAVRASTACSRLVATGTKFVEGQQSMRCKLLDAVFNSMSISVGVEFYITFLPFLFWIDQVSALSPTDSAADELQQRDALSAATRAPLHSADGDRCVTAPARAFYPIINGISSAQRSHALSCLQIHRQLSQGCHVHRSSPG